jgi:hypothetical protein
MLPVRRPRPPARLRPRRRHHQPRRLPSAADLASGLPPRRRGHRRGRTVAVALTACTALAGLVLGTVAPAGAGPHAIDRQRRYGQQPVTYVSPVDAPIADPFRPPAGPYAPGNRGLEYDTAAGTPVRASAAGAVTFAGAVGGALHVTVLHADGVRTSYSFLAAVEVVLGQQVGQGDQLGTTAGRLHFGARAGDAYFDPAALFTGSVTEVELLPFEVPPGSTPDAEARALAVLAMAEGPGLPLPGLGDTLGWLRDRAGSGVTYAQQLNPVARGLSMAADLTDRLLFPGPCSSGPPPPRPVGGQRHRVAVTVAGLGSSSTSGSIDELRVDDLGYDRDRVVRFSYAGGRTPATGSAFAGIGAADYASPDTQGDLATAGGRLADLVEQVAAADPGAVVDVFAHSLGGVVTRLALTELHDRGFDLARLGVVTTLGSPHRGADAATAVVSANTRVAPNLALDAAEGVLGTGLDPDSVAIGQLAEHSDVVRGLAADGVPPGVRLVSIAARGDVVVAAPNTEVAGATNVTVPLAGRSAHGDLVGSDAATGEVARALAGQPPACESWGDAVADVVTGHTVSAVEDHLGAAASMAGW